jgi:hypothetical protein
MRRKRILWMAPLAIVGIALFTFILGEVVMHLWNWHLPDLFGFKKLTFWSAIGLFALCRILFGGFGNPGGAMRSNMRRRMAERWNRMTPEEREKYCQGLYGRWGREEGAEPKAGG